MPINNFVVIASLVLLLVSFWNRNDLPRSIDYVPNILDEPIQSPTRKASFTANYAGVEYLVEPEYEYELVGMIVSFRHHDGNSRMHRMASDHLNMLDVCVIWGDNTANTRLQKISFWNGIFTCNVKTRDQVAWNQFDMNQLSNNHLLSADDRIRDRVKGIRIGDQIRVRGYLAAYSSANGGKRGTSTTRTDTGDGACETFFVEQFDIVESATNYWRMSMYLFLSIFIVGVVVHFRRPHRSYQSH